MPVVSGSVVVAASVAEVFAFFRRPANLVRLAPPELRLELADGPECVELGSRLTWKTRRWGLTQRLVMEVTALDPNVLLVEDQVHGPLRRWRHQRHFETVAGGARLAEEIDFEPPGGLLGLTLTERAIRADLEAAFVYREQRLRELFPWGRD